MKIEVSVVKGLNKCECEDTVLVNNDIITDNAVTIEPDKFVCAVVADGVGGTPGGRQASQFVLKKLAEGLAEVNSAIELEALFKKINNELIAFGKSVNMNRMATTLTGIFVVNGKCLLAHIGNTRLSILQGDYLKQITEDQTTYQWLKKAGDYETAENCNKSEIMYCLGGGIDDYSKGLIVKEIFNTGLPQCLLLTSDGIHDHVDIDTVEEVLTSGMGDKDINKKLTELALENGSSDDKTIILIRNR